MTIVLVNEILIMTFPGSFIMSQTANWTLTRVAMFSATVLLITE